MSTLRASAVGLLVAGLCAAATAPAASADSYVAHPAEYSSTIAPSTQFPVGGPSMQAAREIADRYWGADPCGGAVTLAWTSQAPTLNAAATWTAVGNDLYGDPAHNTNCTVAFNNDQAFDWPTLCTVLVHEFGHLTGHPHSGILNDVMAAVFSQPIPQCQIPDPGKPATAPSAAPAAGAASSQAAASHRVRHRSHRRKHLTRR